MNRLHDLAISDTGFVFDPYSGATFSVNATGLAVLAGLKQGKPRAEILAELESSFDVRGGDLHRDIDEFVGQLRRNELLPRDFELE